MGRRIIPRPFVSSSIPELTFAHECGRTHTREVSDGAGIRIDCGCGAVYTVSISELKASTEAFQG